MGGPGSGRKRGQPKSQPRGAAWRDAREQILQRDEYVCQICGHTGAGDVDHIVSTGDVKLYYDPANLRAAHGNRSRCPVCGKACNQSRGGAQRQLQQAVRALGGQRVPVASSRRMPEPVGSEEQAREMAAQVPWPPPHHPAGCACRSQPRPPGYQVAAIRQWGRPQYQSRCW